ncbi:hypothetical protein [Nonomuraea bangladeshensis]|uniref:hypothetical protein n=1 Tax=Nonomuraea bangladeshensis TaxID=404385 RepID=UPI003C2C7245
MQDHALGGHMRATFSPIPELNLLKEFEDSLHGEPYSRGFELFQYGRVSALGPEPPVEMRDKLIPFAQATASGSFYALWKHDGGKDLARLPVIFCGDEGDLYIAARDLPVLFRLLAAEDEDEPAHGAYESGLERTFGLTPAEDPAAVYQAALIEYGRAFADWWLTFDDADSIIADLLDELEELNL